jgi:hypothetical protein
MINMRKHFGLESLLGAIALFGFAACSDVTDDMTGKDNSTANGFVYQMNVKVDNAGTRSLTLDDENKIHTAWAVGDKIFVYNCSDNDQSNAESYSTVSVDNGGSTSSSFTGSIQSLNPMTEADNLAFFYPGAAIEDEDNVVAVDLVTEQAKDEDTGKKVDVTTYLPSTTIKNQVRLNLGGQDGTLATIDKKYDYNWGVAKPTEIVANGSVYNVSVSVAMDRKVAFWGLKFKDQAGTPITNVKSLEINGVKSSDILKLETGEFIGGDQDVDYSITVSNNGNAINGENGYVWVALLPEASQNINITLVTTDGIIYTKEVHKAFAANKTYRSTITNMEKPMAKPYVEVQNIKWATGNFIHYTDGNEDYWGIAPAQWWISNYADDPTVADWVDPAGKLVPVNLDEGKVGSQYWYINNHETGFGMTKEDCDLFDHGVIAEAFDFKGKKYLPYTAARHQYLEGKWYSKSGAIYNLTEDRTKAFSGDIAHFYTTEPGRNHHYRYPTYLELKDLMKAATIIPAYCYTDKGNKIYGAYFSDGQTGGVVGSKAKNGFPTGPGNLWKFENVTGLVLANKGLFLPIAGWMYGVAGTNRANYRYMDYNRKFSGHYWSSQSSAISTATGLAFGSHEWIYGAAQKTQASSIRPVYIGGDEDAKVDAANYTMFHNILNAEGQRKY